MANGMTTPASPRDMNMTHWLPREIIVHDGVRDDPVTQRVLSRCGDVPIRTVATAKPKDIVAASSVLSGADDKILGKYLAGKNVLFIGDVIASVLGYKSPPHAFRNICKDAKVVTLPSVALWLFDEVLPTIRREKSMSEPRAQSLLETLFPPHFPLDSWLATETLGEVEDPCGRMDSSRRLHSEISDAGKEHTANLITESQEEEAVLCRTPRSRKP